VIHFLDQHGNTLIALPDQLASRMRALARKAYPNETGGIIVGRYDDAHRTALVRKIEGPSSDSVSGPSTFQRGICGIDTLLTRLWLRKVYYLGEWHFHPEPYPKASWIDELQMAELARTTKLRCPEPVLFIVGLPDRGGHIAAYVFRDRLVELTIIP